MTTGRAGGMTQPPWGILPAEPIGSSNDRQPRLFHRLPLKGLYFLPSSAGLPVNGSTYSISFI